MDSSAACLRDPARLRELFEKADLCGERKQVVPRTFGRRRENRSLTAAALIKQRLCKHVLRSAPLLEAARSASPGRSYVV